MHPNARLLFSLLILTCKFSFAQQAGFFIAPSTLVGYTYISKIYHPNMAYAPANKGYNLAFQFGGVAGYKLEKSGVMLEYKSSYFEQNFEQESFIGKIDMRYNTVGVHALYQLGQISNMRYYHTLKFGYLFNTPETSNYLVKDSHSGEIYGDTSMTSSLQNNHMISVEYGITTGYKLLWADLSFRAAYSLNNIYKPSLNTNGRNFYIGFQLAFGLFANTNK